MIVWAVEALVASTILMLLVLALRAPVRRTFGPNIAYLLWALPVVRMALPPLPASWRGGALPVLPMPQDITIYLGDPIATLAVEPGSGFGWPIVLLAVWTLGALLFVGYHLIAHGRFCARVHRDAHSVTPVAAGRVQMIESDAAAGPLAFGVWRKYVAFPRDFADRYDPLERDLALAHELGHHARGDLIANWIALMMLALHWFNPVAWRAFRAFRADQEMACDALVLSGRARELRAAYGRAIVKSAHGGAVSAACHLHTINEIKGRLKMLTRHERTSTGRRLAGGGVIATLVLGGLGLTASGTQAAETVRTRVETVTGVDLAGIELPPLPRAAPPPPQGRGAVSRTVTTTTHRDGKVRRTVRIVTRDRDGTDTHMTDLRTPNGAATAPPAPPIPPEVAVHLDNMRVDMRAMPDISSRSCSDAEGKTGEHVLSRQDGDRKVVVICTNRIERLASLAARDSARVAAQSFVIHRDAQASALRGLRNARRTVETNRDVPDDARTAALAGIDQAIRKMAAGRD